MGSAVHISVTSNWSHHLRHTFGNRVVAPEKLARLRINSDYALAQKLDVLFSPTRLNDNRGCITRRLATRDRRFPDDCASLFVKRHHRGLRASGSYDNDVAINQRRLRIGPYARLAPKLFPDALLP